uniref:ATP synthase subunit 8 n=1 Tax=Pedipes pedipes TaxID=999235 RepID=G8HPB6_9EUPU|nr:ATP synthase F0 subunit 8 [Pedipes pedipes]AEQ93853.1 ATP synthase subunit 8 [Pedipes pedipes]
MPQLSPTLGYLFLAFFLLSACAFAFIYSKSSGPVNKNKKMSKKTKSHIYF